MTRLILENQIAIMRAHRFELAYNRHLACPNPGRLPDLLELLDGRIAATEEALRVWVAERRPIGFTPAPSMSDAEREMVDADCARVLSRAPVYPYTPKP
jgi:hypothetical protein